MATLLLVAIYLAFISLGLPDSLLGAAWPAIYPDIGAPISAGGFITVAVCMGTVISSFLSGWAKKKFGTGIVVFVSVLLTSAGLLIFSIAPSFAVICIACVPLGIGGGAIDSALNNYVALNYKPIHMNWLHCFWGVGAFFGPMIMSFFIVGENGWRGGYRIIMFIQLALALVMLVALPLWGGAGETREDEKKTRSVGFIEMMKIKGAAGAVFSFFFYCAVEYLVGVWGGTQLVNNFGWSEDAAARVVAVYYLSIAAGRFLSGVLSLKLSGKTLVRLGCACAAVGAVSLLIPTPDFFVYLKFALIGLGFAPVYPGIMQDTPKRFGGDMAQSLIGFQVGFAYIGTVTIPPLFGLIIESSRTNLFSPLALVLIALLAVCNEAANAAGAKKTRL